MKIFFQTFLILGVLFNVGCAGFGKKMKAFLGGEEPKAVTQESAAPKYSNTQTVVGETPHRNYRRVTRDSFEKEGMLDESSGSLWVMEGQGSYLFSSNMVRLVGDMVNIEMEGGPRAQLAAKVDVIRKLVEKNRKDQRRELAAIEAAKAAAAKPEKKEGEAKPEGAQTQAAANTTPDASKDKDDKDEKDEVPFDVAMVPSRIVEKMPDGSYKVKGAQQFMIGKKEYKVIATGVVRPSEIKDDTIAASKILDARFDIVSSKKELR
jgi:flagellar L-ring protein precursor FlgH